MTPISSLLFTLNSNQEMPISVHESVKLKPEKVSSFELISFCSLR
jgi:hypothetical protein